MWPATVEVIRFEGKRTRTRGRMMIWLALAFFPSALLVLLQSQAQGNVPREALALMSYYLVVQVGCMLGLLLWATPVVGAELEAQTWIYLAMRQHGKVAVLLGKYLVATVWTASAGVVSAIGVSLASQFDEPFLLARTLIALVLMSSSCYAALYALIGVTAFTRATVIAVVYTLLFEGVLSSVPATINKLTICYRLRALLTEWVGLEQLRSNADTIFGYEPAWQHVGSLGIYWALVTLAALWVIRVREYPVNSDS